MALNRAALEALAESVGDGVPIEWDVIEAQAADDQRPVIRQLRVLDNLAQLHRSLPPVPEDALGTKVPERGLDVPAIGTWGHLALVERLGGGTYGEVYRAWDRQLERDVALKVLRSDRVDPGKLLAEGRLLARVRHQNVVSVYGVDTHEGRIGLWMELVRGVTLEQILERDGPLSAREAALVGIDLCRALAAIHNAGLVHRDVKAQNVMREEGGRIVLMDLGTGRDVGSGEHAAGLAGTPLYLAPEVFEGVHASARTDVYSLGVLLYHLVTGEYPVRAGTFDDLARAHESGRGVRLRDERPDLPTPFVAAVDRALSRDPDVRYQSASALEADLVRALEQTDRTEIAPQRSPFTNPRYLALAAVVVVALGLGAIYWPAAWRPATRGAVAPGEIRTVAVLPLRNDSGDPAQEYFADGMTDEIISTLGRLSGLNVISRTSSMQFKGMQFAGAGTTLPDIARRLNADAVLEGSVMVVHGNGADKGPHKVRITARLIQAGTDTQIWNQTFDSVAEDVIALESQVARAIADGIRVRLSSRQQGALATGQKHTPDFQAFDLYLKGRYYWNLRTKADIERSIDFFQQAIARDPQYAAPHAALADAYQLLGSYGWMPYADAFLRAYDAAQRAIALDDTIGEAHASLGHIRDARIEWEAADASFRRAIELNPGNVSAHHWYGLFLSKRRAFAEATAEIQKAAALDPLSPVFPTLLASFKFESGDYGAAIAQLLDVLKTRPEYVRAHFMLAQAYAKNKQYDLALAETTRTAELGGDGAELRGLVGCILAAAGRTADARAVAEELITRYRDKQEWGPLGIAAIYATLGDKDRAFDWLERGREGRDPLLSYLRVDPWFDPLRDDPRFDRLLATLGLTR